MIVKADPITPFDYFECWWAKREDRAGYTSDAYPSGAKVRQYLRMIDTAPDDAVLLVGCAADSAMQIYVAHAAKVTGRQGYVVVPARKEPSAATRYALANGVIVSEVSPGYATVYRARARELAAALGVPVVRWDLGLAAHDTAEQVINIPKGARRVIVPTGSGLTAAGVLAGLATAERPDVLVVAVAVSDLATHEKIMGTVARRFPGVEIDPEQLVVRRAEGKYGRPALPTWLPDGTRLDPYYAAKAYPYVGPGDVLWVSGRRPDHLG